MYPCHLKLLILIKLMTNKLINWHLLSIYNVSDFIVGADLDVVIATTFLLISSQFTFMIKIVSRKQVDIFKTLNYLSVWFYQQHVQCYSK